MLYNPCCLYMPYFILYSLGTRVTSMNTSLGTYDLSRLFRHSPPTTKESGGEGLVEESLFTEAGTELGSVMTDSLHAVVWED